MNCKLLDLYIKACNIQHVQATWEGAKAFKKSIKIHKNKEVN